MDYKKGDRVRHPKKHDWGLGLVLEDSYRKRVKVHFVEVGEKIMSLEHVQLIKVTDDDAIDPILDGIEAAPSSSETLYRIGKIPNLSAPHNQRTWAIIESKLGPEGSASFEQLVRWCRGHEFSGGGYGFVKYCISERNKWLVPADRAVDESSPAPSGKRESDATGDGADFIVSRSSQENEELLYEYIHNFFGYGSLSSPLWFIGMEEGVGAESLNDRLIAWERLAKSTTVDIREFHQLIKEPRWFTRENPNIQGTWKGPIIAALAYFGMPSGKEKVRQYQRNRLATDDLALLEMMPLPHKCLTTWSHGNIFPTKSAYREHIAPTRISWFKKQIQEINPKAVVMYGTTPPYPDYWLSISGSAIQPKDGWAFKKIGKTIFIVCEHPLAWAPTDSYFHDIGRFLRDSL